MSVCARACMRGTYKELGSRARWMEKEVVDPRDMDTATATITTNTDATSSATTTTSATSATNATTTNTAAAPAAPAATTTKLSNYATWTLPSWALCVLEQW